MMRPRASPRTPSCHRPLSPGRDAAAAAEPEADEGSAEYEFALLVRDVRLPPGAAPLTARLAVTPREMDWTVAHTGCLSVPGHGIVESDSGDEAERRSLQRERGAIRARAPGQTA